MTEKQASDVKYLAKPSYEVMQVITERKCPNCNDGKVLLSHAGFERKCHKCSGTSKIKWEWERKVGDRYVEEHNNVHMVGIGLPICEYKSPVPILEWETLEEILEDEGWHLELTGDVGDKTWCAIYYNHRVRDDMGGLKSFIGEGKSRTEAVYKAIIELGEEIK